MTDQMPLTELLTTYRDGEEHGWPTEFVWIIDHQWPETRRLIENIATHGITKPIMLGPDGRVWDGHHRVLAAVLLGLETVPVTDDDD